MPPKKRVANEATTPSTGSLASFESEFERLGNIVGKLESGSTSLDEMLKLYADGITLAGDLTKLLKEAELRVQKLAQIHEELLDDEASEPELSDEDDETYDE